MSGQNESPGQGLVGRFLSASVVLGVLLAGLLIPVAGLAGAVAQGGTSFFGSLPSELETKPLAEKSILFANDGRTVVARFYEENRVYVPLTAISPNLQRAIVAIEDSRFYEHGGVDMRGIVRAVVHNSQNESTQGASTLTQQYVKNVLIEAAMAKGDKDGARKAIEKSNTRKLREMKLALAVERKLSKDEILERYLNISFFSQRTYGAEAASQYYFGKKAADLSVGQAALLAGMVQSPVALDPVKHPDRALARRNVVLRRMADLGIVSEKQYKAESALPIKLVLKKSQNGCTNAGAYGFFCDYIKKEIVSNPAFSALGATAEERLASLMRGGLKIYSTIDPKLQQTAQKAVDEKIPPGDSSHLAAAAVTVEPGTGKILAMTQDRRFNPDGKSGNTEINYSTTGWQTGSTFKPFVLAAWLNDGRSLNSTVNATARSFSLSEFKSCTGRIPGEAWTPGNSESSETGLMTVTKATEMSVNVAYVDMMTKLNMCDIAGIAEAAGARLSDPSDICGEKKAPDTMLPRCIPAMGLGVELITPLDMANSYATFASGGTYCPTIAINSIVRPGSDNEVPTNVKVPVSACKQTITPSVAAGVSHALKGVLTNGTASRIGPISGYPSAGKTGTTNGPQDTWFVGYTAQRSTAVWVADPGHISDGKIVRRELRGIRAGGRSYGTIYGATIAAPIWKEIMNTAQDGLPRINFGQPPGNLLVVDRVTVPRVLGLPLEEAKAKLHAAGFGVTVTKGVVPSKYPQGTVGITAPGADARAAIGSTIIVTMSGGPLGIPANPGARPGGNPWRP